MQTLIDATTVNNASTNERPAEFTFQALIDAAAEQACRAIAPTWPLDRSIAVNPHWSRINRPLRDVAARMAVLAQIQVFPARTEQRAAWKAGRIDATALNHALQSVPDAAARGLDVARCLAALDQAPAIATLPLLIDLLDQAPNRDTRLSWRHAITHQVSQTCAAYFDQHQADWQAERRVGLYAFWRDTLIHDHGIGLLMGLPQLGQALHALPATPAEAERWVLSRLGLPESTWADYLEAVLLTVNGWASWCAYLGWQAGQNGQADPHLRELLAIRLAWGVILLACAGSTHGDSAFKALQAHWQEADRRFAKARTELLIDEVWQVALEYGYQQQLRSTLLRQQAPLPAVTPTVQAAFCIDVRSEPMRRAIESIDPSIQTIGFAGFFGLPISYTPIGTKATRPQLPGLLAPSMGVCEALSPGNQNEVESLRATRQTRLLQAAQELDSKRWPGTAFSFVESVGLGYIGKLATWLRPSRRTRARDDHYGLSRPERHQCRPRLAGLDVDAQTTLAAKVLQAMGLIGHIADLVLLVGHGSQTRNNAHAAALDCGACCGQTGEVNARVLAALLNDASVRTGLKTKGLVIPDSSWFIACLHNTTTDELEAFDLDLLPTSNRQSWLALAATLLKAGDRVRRERARGLSLNVDPDRIQLLKRFQRRANDGAETRPEWGLAGNAAFLIAPRALSAGRDLGGRTFLHDYNADQDTDGSLLELLMTAPMLVTHWINWQYHASTCEPLRFGSGNKTLHNVVGGSLGVFEGNGGDLRIGLARQSLHNGERWVHEPLRLTVVIAAPIARIDAILQKHVLLRQLVSNGWVHLWQIEQGRIHVHLRGSWCAC